MINIIPVAVSMLLSVTAATSVAAVPLSQNSVLVARQAPVAFPSKITQVLQPTNPAGHAPNMADQASSRDIGQDLGMGKGKARGDDHRRNRNETKADVGAGPKAKKLQQQDKVGKAIDKNQKNRNNMNNQKNDNNAALQAENNALITGILAGFAVSQGESAGLNDLVGAAISNAASKTNQADIEAIINGLLTELGKVDSQKGEEPADISTSQEAAASETVSFARGTASQSEAASITATNIKGKTSDQVSERLSTSESGAATSTASSETIISTSVASVVDKITATATKAVSSAVAEVTNAATETLQPIIKERRH